MKINEFPAVSHADTRLADITRLQYLSVMNAGKM